MKKQVSVFGLHTRAALNRLLLAALGLLAVELILAGVCIARGTALTLSGSRLETALQHSFRAGIIALQVLLASSLGSNSRYGYTLRRLRVSERCVFLWSCVCNTLCFAVLWCVQIMAAVGAAFWNANSARYSAGPQGVFVDFYYSDIRCALSVFVLKEIDSIHITECEPKYLMDGKCPSYRTFGYFINTVLLNQAEYQLYPPLRQHRRHEQGPVGQLCPRGRPGGRRPL